MRGVIKLTLSSPTGAVNILEIIQDPGFDENSRTSGKAGISIA
jgi:hypothetical protein